MAFDLGQKDTVSKAPKPKKRGKKAKVVESKQPTTIKEALPKHKELWPYVNMDARFRTGLTSKELAKGKALVNKLKLPMPPIPAEYEKTE